MDMNLTTVKKTWESYVAALQRLTNRGFDKLMRSGSGYTHYLGEEFHVYGGNKSDADKVSIRIDSLMEYGRPKVIEKSFFVYKSSFISFTFWSIEPYNVFHLSRDWDTNKEVIKEDKQHISVKHSEFGIGLGYWNTEKKDELRKLAITCKEPVKAKILAAIEQADKEVAEWQEARKKIAEDIVGTA